MNKYLKQIDEEKIKLPLFLSIILILFVIVLHNPTQGYLTEFTIDCEDCPSWMYMNFQAGKRSFFEMESLGALWKPIGVVSTALMVILSVIISNIVWIFLFCLRKK